MTISEAFDEEYLRQGDAAWERKRQKKQAAGAEQEDVAPAFSDEAMAINFATRHANDLRYVPAWNCWLIWDGKRWANDEKLKVFTLARNLCREAASQANKGSAAIASRKKVAAVEQMVRSDQRLVVTIDELDADPWMLNTPTGTLDLRTGQLRNHSQDDKLTKITGAAPEKLPTPVWEAFLARVTNNKPELIGFIKRVSGYALTGLTREHALFFLFGRGANGKSTLINVLIDCLGDYHKTAPIETFTASTSERHPTDLASLRGARLVTATETEEGRRWAESKIKALTGGDRIPRDSCAKTSSSTPRSSNY